MEHLNEVITNGGILSNRCCMRDGFFFKALTHPANVYDAIIVRSPSYANTSSPLLGVSARTLEEHIQLINDYKLEKAVIIAEDISFITQCPTLRHVSVIPADTVGDGFDFSPLYLMPELRSASCHTEYGKKDQFSSTVDYSRIRGLVDVGVSNRGHLNYNKIPMLRSLGISHYKAKDISEMFCSKELDTLQMIQCGVESLEGIEKSEKMQCLYLYYDRKLQDISQLSKVKDTLRALCIENCPKIEDFSVLKELKNLELLRLHGSNSIPSLDFLKELKSLKTFTFSINVLDGDLMPCKNLSYVYSGKNRKHYNLKNKDMPNGNAVRGNEDIELWRRLE